MPKPKEVVEEPEEEKPKEEKERWVEGEIPTQTAPVIIDLEDKNPETRVYTVERALVQVLNILEELKGLI